jgi:chemotaxis methyl-accepting protein methylase
MKIVIKDMKLSFSRTDTHWKKVIQDMEGNVLFEEVNLISTEPTKEEFDAWEIQMKQIPVFNIVEVERFI